MGIFHAARALFWLCNRWETICSTNQGPGPTSNSDSDPRPRQNRDEQTKTTPTAAEQQRQTKRQAAAANDNGKEDKDKQPQQDDRQQRRATTTDEKRQSENDRTKRTHTQLFDTSFTRIRTYQKSRCVNLNSYSMLDVMFLPLDAYSFKTQLFPRAMRPIIICSHF